MRRNGFLTFLSSLIPGVGYMYLGLIKKGVQALAIFLLIDPVFSILGMGDLSNIVAIPYWCYTFFDTMNLAGKMDKGEIINDSDFIVNFSKTNGGFQLEGARLTKMAAWILIALGSLAFIHNMFGRTELYQLIVNFSKTYFIPVIFICGGLYLLFRNPSK